jgi:hypothetical protein
MLIESNAQSVENSEELVDYGVHAYCVNYGQRCNAAVRILLRAVTVIILQRTRKK